MISYEIEEYCNMGFHLISPFTEEKYILLQKYILLYYIYIFVLSDLFFKPHKTDGNHAHICHVAAVLEFLLRILEPVAPTKPRGIGFSFEPGCLYA